MMKHMFEFYDLIKGFFNDTCAIMVFYILHLSLTTFGWATFMWHV